MNGTVPTASLCSGPTTAFHRNNAKKTCKSVWLELEAGYGVGERRTLSRLQTRPSLRSSVARIDLFQPIEYFLLIGFTSSGVPLVLSWIWGQYQRFLSSGALKSRDSTRLRFSIFWSRGIFAHVQGLTGSSGTNPTFSLAHSLIHVSAKLLPNTTYKAELKRSVGNSSLTTIITFPADKCSLKENH